MSIYRNIVWFAKGLREYTKSGYEAASKSFNAGDLDVDCSGRSFLITGANSGIGKSVALEAARRGGIVHLVCRNGKSAEEAKDEIVRETGNNKIHIHLVDMSVPSAVYKFGKNFAETQSALNVLVNNAGCMIGTREVDENGLEKNFATNTLGTHILTKTLIPLLSKYPYHHVNCNETVHDLFVRSEKPRVIIVSSGGMLTQKLDVKDLHFEKMKPFDGTMAYAQNKRQQIVMTTRYAESYPNVHFSSMHPGWADTPAVRSSMPDFYEKMKNKLRTAEQGADTAVWLAVSDAALGQPTGMFFQDRKPVAVHLPLAWTHSSKDEEKELMDQLESLMQKFAH